MLIHYQEGTVSILGALMVIIARFRPALRDSRPLDDVVEVLNDQAVASKFIRTGRSLGKGQYAEVFLGYDCADGKRVAIKRIDWNKQVRVRANACVCVRVRACACAFVCVVVVSNHIFVFI